MQTFRSIVENLIELNLDTGEQRFNILCGYFGYRKPTEITPKFCPF